MNERRPRRFSQAISEGEGISVVAEVSSSADAEVAARAGAAALVVREAPTSLDDAVDLPVLNRSRAAASGDARVVDVAGSDDEELERRYQEVVESGAECVVEVDDEEQLERVLELLDPEIVLLSCRADADDKLESVLDLLPDVPAGKLVVADVGGASGADVAGLERVGVDAVIVAAHDVAAVVGDGRTAG